MSQAAIGEDNAVKYARRVKACLDVLGIVSCPTAQQMDVVARIVAQADHELAQQERDRLSAAERERNFELQEKMIANNAQRFDGDPKVERMVGALEALSATQSELAEHSKQSLAILKALQPN